ncbi:type II secretion system F family protein [Aliibacillus thermotolerans]|uniref:Type II secretion system F family protein n=1 Tax=Aliibacillus thermotolerans TaxID=1834418 RepID=A0ABW0U335_9BACI|nr:type II secretion system F family protein [Aliibacillus thermotolerans]MDA3129154.1 pilus assembly protein TadB [Aliibacillus thermotolerans]
MNEALITIIILLIACILLCLFISFVYIWLFIARKQTVYQYVGGRRKKVKKKKPFKERMMIPLLKGAVYLGPTAIKYPIVRRHEQYERMLLKAGNPYQLTLQDFYGFRYIIGISAYVFGWLYYILGLPFALYALLLFPVSTFFLPDIWLYFKAKERQEKISLDIPDFLDVVSVSLNAGASLDGAMVQVAKQMGGPLGEEIERFNREINLGVPRTKAYENLLYRNDAPELEMLIQSLIQGGELGVPVSRTFRVQADDLRSTRGFRAKEKAAKASPKVTAITTLTIVPSVFVLVLGLLFLNFIYNPEAFGLDIFLR